MAVPHRRDNLPYAGDAGDGALVGAGLHQLCVVVLCTKENLRCTELGAAEPGPHTQGRLSPAARGFFANVALNVSLCDCIKWVAAKHNHGQRTR